MKAQKEKSISGPVRKSSSYSKPIALKIHSTGVTDITKIPTFSEVCKKGALRIKTPNEEASEEILTTDMTCCQKPQSYHTQSTMTDR